MFWILHIIVFLFFIPGLIITIPLHIINTTLKVNQLKRELRERKNETKTKEK